MYFGREQCIWKCKKKRIFSPVSLQMGPRSPQRNSWEFTSHFNRLPDRLYTVSSSIALWPCKMTEPHFAHHCTNIRNSTNTLNVIPTANTTPTTTTPDHHPSRHNGLLRLNQSLTRLPHNSDTNILMDTTFTIPNKTFAATT